MTPKIIGWTDIRWSKLLEESFRTANNKSKTSSISEAIHERFFHVLEHLEALDRAERTEKERRKRRIAEVGLASVKTKLPSPSQTSSNAFEDEELDEHLDSSESWHKENMEAYQALLRYVGTWKVLTGRVLEVRSGVWWTLQYAGHLYYFHNSHCHEESSIMNKLRQGSIVTFQAVEYTDGHYFETVTPPKWESLRIRLHNVSDTTESVAMLCELISPITRRLEALRNRWDHSQIRLELDRLAFIRTRIIDRFLLREIWFRERHEPRLVDGINPYSYDITVRDGDILIGGSIDRRIYVIHSNGSVHGYHDSTSL